MAGSRFVAITPWPSCERKKACAFSREQVRNRALFSFSSVGVYQFFLKANIDKVLVLSSNSLQSGIEVIQDKSIHKVLDDVVRRYGGWSLGEV